MLYVIAIVLIGIWFKLHAIRRELSRANSTLDFFEEYGVRRDEPS